MTLLAFASCFTCVVVLQSKHACRLLAVKKGFAHDGQSGAHSVMRKKSKSSAESSCPGHLRQCPEQPEAGAVLV